LPPSLEIIKEPPSAHPLFGQVQVIFEHFLSRAVA
jgi:hypothetical protein